MNILRQALATVEADMFGGRAEERPVDAAFVIYRLEEAGATLLSLPSTGYSTRLTMSHLDVVPSVLEAAGPDRSGLRPATPSASRISRMDEALGWIALIPADRRVIRRHRGREEPGEPGDGTASVLVAPPGGGGRRGPQGGAALAWPGDRHAGGRSGRDQSARASRRAPAGQFSERLRVTA